MGTPELAAASLAMGPPMVALGMCWSAIREGRPARAETLATFAGTWSWMLMGAGGVFAVLGVLAGFPIWRHAVLLAGLATPVALWLYARSLYGAIRARREADARRAGPTPPVAGGGSAARG